MNKHLRPQMKKLFLAFAISFFFTTAGFSQSPSDKPNVLFIVVDDLRPALGCYGDVLAKTPNIDALAAKGTVFTNAYCQQAVCGPSRASFMTGRRPDHTGVWNLTTHFRTALPNVVTLPQYFKLHGYFSRQIGKIYHDPQAAQDRQSWSAPEILAVTTNLGKYAVDTNLKKAPKAWSSERAGVPDNKYIDGMVADAAVAELTNLKSKPFFLAVGFRRPHLPFSVPQKFWDSNASQRFAAQDPNRAAAVPSYSEHSSVELRGYTDIPDAGPISPEKAEELIRGYYASVAFTDAQVGKVLAALTTLGLEKNTVVILISDHGFHLGEHAMWGKTTNSRIDTRVPLIVYDPALTNHPGNVRQVVELVDLYATLASRCKLPAPETDGASFSPLLTGKGKWEKEFALSQFPDVMNYKNKPAIMGYAIHSAVYGYTEWIDLETKKQIAAELYDYKNDPGENNNVVSDKKYEQLRRSLSLKLRQMIR